MSPHPMSRVAAARKPLKGFVDNSYPAQVEGSSIGAYAMNIMVLYCSK